MSVPPLDYLTPFQKQRLVLLVSGGVTRSARGESSKKKKKKEKKRKKKPWDELSGEQQESILRTSKARRARTSSLRRHGNLVCQPTGVSPLQIMQADCTLQLLLILAGVLAVVSAVYCTGEFRII